MYEYKPLPGGRKIIRLLLLYPRNPKGQFSCTPTETTLDATPRFQAVSYTWDPLTKTSNILIDGRIPCSYGQRIGPLTGHVILSLPAPPWIDSVCIGQSGVAEKSARM